VLRYIARRLLYSVLVLIVISILTFLIFVKQPAGDPARRAVGRRTDPVQIANARRAFGLDRPLIVQYGRFAKGLIPLPNTFLSEDVYYSFSNYLPVREEIWRRLPVSAILGAGAAALWLVVGIPLGIASGVRPRSLTARWTMVLAIVGVSVPVFWLGQLLLYFLWFKLRLAPSSGLGIDAGVWSSALAGKFILPWITVAVGYAAIYARMLRSNMLETTQEDYIRTARAKGLSETRVVYKHALRGALTPIVTMLGMDFANPGRPGHHGEPLRAPGTRAARRPVDRQQRLLHGDGRDGHRVDVHPGRQQRGGHRVRLPRSARPVLRIVPLVPLSTESPVRPIEERVHLHRLLASRADRTIRTER
jgi:peptide/nickel transport system permease protein